MCIMHFLFWNQSLSTHLHVDVYVCLFRLQLGVYKWVVDDVTKTVREEFLNEGVDSQVLEDLKQVGSGFEGSQRE